LTTNILLHGWGVTFASDVLAATDTPTTLTRWLKQQVRWSRAAHVESLFQPRIYATSHPLLFFGMIRRELGPLIGAAAILYYLATARYLVAVSASDIIVRFILSSVYSVFRNPDRLTGVAWWWVIAGIVFYHVPLPAVQTWSLLTLTADGWGTTMRASGEQKKEGTGRQAWFDMGFFVLWIGVVSGAAARWLWRYYCFDLPNEGIFVLCFVLAGSFVAYHKTIGAGI
jgi:hyaluronan synthase